MPAGPGTRKCHRSPLLQEVSDAHYGLPEGKFPMKLGICSSLLTPSVLRDEVRGARPRDGGAAGTSCTAMVPGFRKLRLEVPRLGCAPQHSARVQHNAQQLLPSWGFLLLTLDTKAWVWERPAV